MNATSAVAAPHRLPAYGRQLLEIRKHGRVPRRSQVWVALHWRINVQHGAHPLGYVLVIDDMVVPGALDWSIIAGLWVTLLFDEQTSFERLQDAVAAILNCKPVALQGALLGNSARWFFLKLSQRCKQPN